MKRNETPRDGLLDDADDHETWRDEDDGRWHFTDRASNITLAHFDHPPRTELLA